MANYLVVVKVNQLNIENLITNKAKIYPMHYFCVYYMTQSKGLHLKLNVFIAIAFGSTIGLANFCQIATQG